MTPSTASVSSYEVIPERTSNRNNENQPLYAASFDGKSIIISKAAGDAFRSFLKKNQNYLASSAGVFHTDNHSNW